MNDNTTRRPDGTVTIEGSAPDVIDALLNEKASPDARVIARMLAALNEPTMNWLDAENAINTEPVLVAVAVTEQFLATLAIVLGNFSEAKYDAGNRDAAKAQLDDLPRRIAAVRAAARKAGRL